MNKKGELITLVMIAAIFVIFVLALFLASAKGKITGNIITDSQDDSETAASAEQAPIVGRAMEIQRQKNTVFLAIIIVIAIALAVYLLLTRKKKKK
jgi:preprotein translocase subunit SecG